MMLRPRWPPVTVLILTLFLVFGGLQGSVAAARVHHTEARSAVAAGAAQKPLDHSTSGGEDAGTNSNFSFICHLITINRDPETLCDLLGMFLILLISC